MTISAHDLDLMHEFTRVVPVGRGLDAVLWLEVAVLTWPLPHTPALRWESVLSLAAYASKAEVAAARAALLDDPRYFGYCRTCGQRQLQGHLQGPTFCQVCAEDRLGTVLLTDK